MREFMVEGNLSISKLVILFMVGAFLGDIIETIFCRLAARKWMNRSTYIFWPLSSVWGGAFLLASISYYWFRNSNILTLFLVGFIFGTLYEYLYSAVLERFLFLKFWDYSGFRYHIKGRVNLPYSIGWGIVAIVWIKVLYPRVASWLMGVSSSALLAVGIALALELLIDTAVSFYAFVRYSRRYRLGSASNRMSAFVDRYYTDAYMEDAFPYMLRTDSRR